MRVKRQTHLMPLASAWLEEGVNEQAAGAATFGLGTDDDGADLGEVLAIDVEGCAAEELVGVGFDDGEGADVGADLGVGAAEEGAVVAEALDQLMDGVGVLQLRFTSAHGVCFELGAGGVERGCGGVAAGRRSQEGRNMVLRCG